MHLWYVLLDIYLYEHIYTAFLYSQFTRWFNILPMDDDVDAHDVVIVHVFLAGDGDNKCNDFTSDDAMLLLDE